MLKQFYSFTSEIFNNGASYSFITRNNAEYSVYFTDVTKIIDILDDFQVISNAMYMTVEVAEIENEKTPFDSLIGITISAIIMDYYSYYGDNLIIVYNCDERDGRQSLRFEKFNRWFNRYSKDSSLISYNKSIFVEEQRSIDDIAVYITFMFSKKNVQISNIWKELIKLENTWTGK